MYATRGLSLVAFLFSVFDLLKEELYMRKCLLILALFFLIISLFSCAKENHISITFIENGGTEVEDMMVNITDASINLPEPTRLGYTFNGWYLDEALTNPFIAVILSKTSLTLYAKWTINHYTITFEENDGSEEIDLNQPYQSLVTEPTPPTKIGHIFNGWYLDIQFTTPYNFTTMPAENITLYAKWTPIQYTIVFNENGGSEVSNITQAYLSDVTPPTNPTKVGYTFGGWYTDPILTIPYTFTTMPHLGIELFAKWTINSYTIRFEVYGGSILNDITLEFMTPVIEPEPPTKEGFTFIAWYLDELFTTPYTFSTMPPQNIILYAKWEVNQYSITYYMLDDIDPLSNIVLNPGETIIQVSSGESHFGALTSCGRLFMWGYNDYGQIGNNTNYYALNPIEITNNFSLDSDDKIIEISLAGSNSSALTLKGRLFMWGYNYYGQIGDNTNITKFFPTEITHSFILDSDDKIIQVSLGTFWYSSALTLKGRLFMWGYNEYGQLGDFNWMDRLTPSEITHRFNLDSGDRIIQVSLGGLHSSALTLSGKIFVWGYNDYGQIGNYSTITFVTPIDITSRFNLETGDRIIQVSLGIFHSSALTLSGRLFMWGYNNNGQLGDNTDINRLVPLEITSRLGLQNHDLITQVSLGWTHSSALSSTGRLFMWGSNISGQLGDLTKTDRFVPTEITTHFGLENADMIIYLSMGFNNSQAITSSGRFFKWGWDKLVPTLHKTYTYEIQIITYDYQSIINYIPVKEGYLIDAWYTDAAYTTLFTDVMMPAEDMILYGKWIKN
jgi:uncharacterized repeat protein (TIGR02543 family)